MLYIAATPIGNLQDITLRALDMLKKADLVIVESFADSKKLLNAYDIHPTQVKVYNDSNKKKVTQELLKELASQDHIAVYISSAGTPAISDPGADLVSACRDTGIEVIPLPGASALTTLVSISGIRSKNILFTGFLPKRKGKIKKVFEKIDNDTALVFYESKFRLLKSLEFLQEIHPDAILVIGREMTKKFETYMYLTVSEAITYFEKHAVECKGEFAVMVSSPNK